VPVFDADGNMTSGPVAGSDGTFPGVPAPALATLVWDAENRLVTATVGQTIITYQYDYLGRLRPKTTRSKTQDREFDSNTTSFPFQGL
jgi:YD repeat-containing protein